MEPTRGGWGQGSLTEVGKGRWRYRLPKHLGRGQFTILARTRTEALRQAQTIRAEAAGVSPDREMPSFSEWCERFLSTHEADPHTIDKIDRTLTRARRLFGDLPLDQITQHHIRELRQQMRHLAASTRNDYHRSVSQILNAAVKAELIQKNVAAQVDNPPGAPAMVEPFPDWDTIFRVADEMPPMFRAVPVFAAGTGLRPEEWVALERSDLHLSAPQPFLTVQRVFTRGVLKETAKTKGSIRRVPLQQVVVDALRDHPARLDSRLLFPAKQGGFIRTEYWRPDVWRPSLDAAGVDYRRIYDLRHTFASMSLSAGVPTWHLAKVMGTSIGQIERTYGRWMHDSDSLVLGLLDTYSSGQRGKEQIV